MKYLDSVFNYVSVLFIFITLSDLADADESYGLSISRQGSRRRRPDDLLAEFADLINEGEGSVEYIDGNVILVLGNVGSGKTTLTYFLTEDNSKLTSVRSRGGQFLIRDADNTISSSPGTPKTIFPQLFYDTEANNAYYDCPGFDLNNSLKEIASAHFLKTVLHYAENIKLIFTVDYSSLQDNTDDFLSLIEYLTEFLKSLDKYANSIALVVTKVESDSTDEEVVNYIGEFVKAQKEILEEAYRNVTMNENDKNALKILDIFVAQIGGKYKKIGIFRRPNQPSSLDKIDFLQEKKHLLYNLIDGLEYTAKAHDDFGQFIGDKAYEDIEKLYRKANQKANNNMNDIFDQIQRHQDIKLEKTTDIFRSLKTEVIPSLDNLKKCIDFEKFNFANILNCVSYFQPSIYVLCNDFFQTAAQIEYMKIVKAVGANKTELEDVADENFLTRMQLSLTENTVDFVVWDTIYSNVHKNLKTYTNQVNRTHSKFSTLDPESATNYQQVFFEQFNISQQLSLSNRQTKPKVVAFNKIINEMQNYEVTYECTSPGSLTIKGNFIVSSQVDIQNKCPGPITDVIIFGLYKIFLDSLPSDLSLLNIALVSPELEQVNFSLMTYIQNLPRSTKFWVLSYTNLIWSRFDHYLYVKPCKGSLAGCYEDMFANTINKFKVYVLDNSTLQRNQDIEFFKTLNKQSWAFVNIYNTAGLIDEFVTLENQFYNLKGKVDLLPFYQLLLERIEKYAGRPVSGENTLQYKKALRYLYTATLSKIYNIESGLDDSLIIDIKEYLRLIIDNIQHFQDTLKKSAISKMINDYKSKFDADIERKIEEGNNFIEKYISPEIEKILEELDQQIPLLFEEIADIRSELEEDIRYTRRKYTELEGIIAKKAILTAISLLSKIFFFFGFFGALVSATIDATVGLVGSLTPNDINFNRQMTQLPQGVPQLLEESSVAFQMIEDQRIKTLENKLNVVLHYLRNEDEYPESYTKFRGMKLELRNIKYARLSLDRIEQLTNEFNTEMESMEQQANRYRRRATKKLVMKKINQGIEVAQYSIGAFNSLQDDEQKLEALANMIETAQGNLKDLKQYEDKVYTLVAPTMKSMKSYIHDLKEDASVQSEIGVLISKWEMQTVLKDVKFELQRVTSGFKVEDSLGRCIEKLYESMSTMMTIYERMQQYKDNRKLVDFTANIALAVNDGTGEPNTQIGKSIKDLDEMINSNLILSQYERSVNAFKQYIFPFADLFLEKYKLPKVLRTNDTQSIIGDILRQLEDLERKVSISQITVDKRIDSYVTETEFSSNFTASKPFYVWKNSQFKSVISRLLSGEEIVLKADVMNNAHDKNAIKFNLVGINLKAIKNSIQNELDDVLKNFVVTMTHMGSSHYRCDDKYYMIKSESQEIVCSFEKDSSGTPIVKNRVYTKIASGDLMLSPYTMWRFKLKPHTDVDFDALDKFKNRVDLELVGHGYYVSKNSEVCRFNLEQHYKLVNPVYDIVSILSTSSEKD